MISCYGLTESTITATSYEPGPPEPAGFTGDELIPLGEPLAGVRAYVLDEELREVPPAPRASCTWRAPAWRAATTAGRA